MRGASQGLSEADLRDLVRYIAEDLPARPPLPKPEKPGAP